jgi:hypothetical protein
MKLTTKQLKQIIKEELNEMQTHLGLPHVFTGFDLAGKLYEFADMADPNQPNENAEQIRELSLNRLVKLRYRLSNELKGSIDAQNIFQEIQMLEDAMDYYDTAMEDYSTRVSYGLRADEPNKQYYPVDKTGQTRMLNRRRRQKKSKLSRDYHREYTKDKGY